MCLLHLHCGTQGKHSLVQVNDTSQRADFGIHGPPIVVASIVSRSEQVLPPAVVGHLIEDPAALQHMEGVDLIETEAIMDAGAVFSELGHDPPVVVSLIQPYPVRTGLW